MASRWRRFAFFDRSNVPLPKSAQVELLPHDGYDNYGRPASTTDNNNNTATTTNTKTPVSLIAVPTNMKSNLDPTNNSTATTNNNHIATTNRAPNEDCRILLYIASRNSHKIHSIDVTDKVTNNSAGDAELTNCGYRGSFLPNYQNPSTHNNAGGILGLAACVHLHDDHANANLAKSNVHLASISSVPNTASEIAVTVTINPHLKLSSSGDEKSFKNDATIDSETLLSSRGTNLAECNGCVDITSEKHWCYVAVGTNSGKVMLYSYYAAKDLETVVSHDCDGTNLAADNPWAAPKMNLVCEIAAPNSNSNSSSVNNNNTVPKDGVVHEANVTAATGASTANAANSTATSSTSSSSSSKFACSYSVTSVQFVPTATANSSKKHNSKSSSGSTMHHHGPAAGGGGAGHGGSKPPVKLFVCYRRHEPQNSKKFTSAPTSQPGDATNLANHHGVCCYEIFPSNATSSSHYNSYYQNCIESRVDLDGRDVANDALCGLDAHTGNLVVARSDGLYVYSPKDHRGAAAVEGEKYAMCSVPPPYSSLHRARLDDDVSDGNTSNANNIAAAVSASSYALIATMDSKSNRDAVDLYDASNKLVAFHMLLSPGHRALRAYGIQVPKELEGYGRASAVLLTSGGTIVVLTEKSTAEKVGLLLQKNLYAAAISIAFADPSYPTTKVAVLYRQHAEYLYQKGDFEAAMDQYILTIGSLEPSHVIFRYLDAPKIPLLVKYLEVFRLRASVATSVSSVHDDLLRTCYLKLNDPEAAEKLKASSSSSSSNSPSSEMGVTLSDLANGIRSPSEALSILCSFEAEEAAQAMKVQGPYLVKSLPRETAGVVISLCDGTYSPNSLTAARSLVALSGEALETSLADRPKVCRLFPVEMFSAIFLEQPKLLRLILSHCKRSKCTLTPSLRRTHLELTLEEWSNAKRDGDDELEHARAKEAMIALTDSFIDDIGVYEALVLVQLANFGEGEVLLYEKLQMGTPAPMFTLLMDRYAADGGERARRQMLAMCQQGDPELLADVLGHFVTIASNKLTMNQNNRNEEKSSGSDEDDDDESDGSTEDIMEDIQETLDLAKAQGVLPPVRIARILAGEGTGQFSYDKEIAMTANNANAASTERNSVPLSVGLDYIGSVLDESTAEIERLKKEVQGYYESCNSMQAEIDELLNANNDLEDSSKQSGERLLCPNLNVEALYAKLCDSLDEPAESVAADGTEEEFWRDMGHCDGDARFGTIARYFGKGLIP